MAADNQIDSQIIEIPKGEVNDLMDLVTEQQLTRTKSKAMAEVPTILLPYQSRWHQDDSIVRLALKSRRIGWSWGCMAAEGALEASKINGMNQYYMGYNLGMAAENIGDAIKFAQVYGMAVSGISVHREREIKKVTDPELGVLGERKQDVTRYKMTFKSGFVYESLSSAPWNWRGRQGHARIDEAAFHRDLMEVIKGALAFRLWGGRIDVVSSHNGQDNPFNLLVRDIEAGKIPWSMHRVDFDDALADGLYKRISLIRGIGWTPELEAAFRQEAFDDYPNQEDANEELLCIPKKGSGVYMPRFLIENCQDASIPTLRFSKPADFLMNPNRIAETQQWCEDNIKPVIDNMDNKKRSAYGQDFGRSGDLSVIWVGQEEGKNAWEVSLAIELRNLPFDVQAHIRDYVIDHLPHFHHGSFDGRGNGQSHAEGAVQRYGESRISLVMATQQFYAEWFPKYKSAYEGKYISVPKDEDVVSDHRRVILTNGKPSMDSGRDKGSDGGDRHGDSAIAGLMFWHAGSQDDLPAAGAQVESNHQQTYAPSRSIGRRIAGMFKRT